MATAPAARTLPGHTPWLAADLPHWLLPPRHWGAVLARLSGMGFNTVHVTAPWRLHEAAPGQFRFGGALDLPLLLRTARQEGLRVWLTVGPCADTGLPGWGMPHRVLTTEGAAARTARRTQALIPTPFGAFPLPSASSPVLLREIAPFFRVLTDQLVTFTGEGGPLAAVGLAAPWFLTPRHGAHDTDYHPNAVAHYHTYLQDSYGAIATLNQRYGTNHQRFTQVLPPGGLSPPDNLHWHLDWLSFQDYLTATALVHLKDAWRREGLDTLPVLGQARLGHGRWPHLGLLCQSVDVPCLSWDGHSPPGTWQALSALPLLCQNGAVTGPLLVNGLEDTTATLHRLPQVPGAGLRLDVVARPDRPGGLVDAEGNTPDPTAAATLTRCLQTLHRHHTDLRRRAPTAGVLRPRLYEDLARLDHGLAPFPLAAARLLGWPADQLHAAAGHLPQFATPLMRELPFWYPHLLAHYTGALQALGHDTTWVDEASPTRLLKSLKVLVVPCLGVMGQGAVRVVDRFCAVGGRVIVAPVPPLVDPSGHRCTDLPPIPAPASMNDQRTVGDTILYDEWHFEEPGLTVDVAGEPTAVVQKLGTGRIVYLTGLTAQLPPQEGVHEQLSHALRACGAQPAGRCTPPTLMFSEKNAADMDLRHLTLWHGGAVQETTLRLSGDWAFGHGEAPGGSRRFTLLPNDPASLTVHRPAPRGEPTP